ncbi:DMT family transporter [Yoonia tamlensis]|nr:DMT family transporter [Yoonia tamlensis]
MNNTLKAALWMLAAIASFTSMAVAGRAVSGDLDTFEIMLFRSLTGIVIVLVVASVTGNLGQIGRNKLGLHMLRNICHFTGQNLWFFAIATIPLAQVFALEFTTPIWVILLAPLILREKMTAVGMFSALLGFVGVLIVTRPDTAVMSPGLIAGAICAIFFALSAIFTRKLTLTEPITVIMFYLTVTQAVFGLICAGYDGDITLPTGTTIPLIILIGFAGLFAHFCLTTALSIAPLNVVMPFDFFRLPTIAVVGMIWFDEPIQMMVFAGAALIFGANYLNISYGSAKRGHVHK